MFHSAYSASEAGSIKTKRCFILLENLEGRVLELRSGEVCHRQLTGRGCVAVSMRSLAVQRIACLRVGRRDISREKCSQVWILESAGNFTICFYTLWFILVFTPNVELRFTCLAIPTNF